MPQYSSVFDLSTINGTNGFRLDGDFDVISGQSVASAGDVNNDGYDDMIVGAAFANPGGDNNAGSAFVVFGKGTAFAATFTMSAVDGTNGFRLDGIDVQDYAGRSVASAGDINGDGFDDMIVGANGADPGGDANAGESYVVFGKASGFSAALDLSTLDGTNGFRLDGIVAGDQSGRRVSSAGDVNGDGFADLIVGAFDANPGGDGGAGESYVVFGKASGWTASLDLSTLNGTNGFRLDGIDAYDFSGYSVASAGDVNGDGFADIIIGAYGAAAGGDDTAGETYVVFGKASGFAAALDLSTLDGTNGFRLDGIDVYDRSGLSVASAGDVNGDGFADLIVGAPYAAIAFGETYIVFGKASGFAASLDLSTLNGTTGFRIDGIDNSDTSGWSVASAGDWNGDGFDDLIIGARAADPGGDGEAGETYVVFGKASGFAAALSLSTLDGNTGFRLDGIAFNDQSGFSVASAGDVNGDGFDDVMMGAPFASPGGLTNAGESYVVFGGKPGEAVTRTGTAIANRINGGDLNDALVGLGGNDTLIGHGGIDNLIGGLGDDTLDGGAGNDVATYLGGAAVTVDLLIVGAQNTGGQGFDTLIGIENLIGSAFADTLSGDNSDGYINGEDGDDVLNGRGGGDLLSAGAGNDTLNGGTGGDTMYGGLGDDTYHVDSSGDFVSEDPGQGADTVVATLAQFILAADFENLTSAGGGSFTGYGTAGANVLTGGAGADGFIALGGADSGSLGASNDYVYAGDGNDNFSGDAGTDILLGENGDDTLNGGAEQDYLYGLADNDTLNGDGGVDVLIGDIGNDTLNGGTENDYLYGGAGDDAGNGGDGADAFVMEGGNDIVNGDAGNDFVYAGNDNDTVNGGADTDVLLGEAGNDQIDGGAGVDYVFLGTGDDTFIMDGAVAGVNVDVLYDFTPGAGSADVLRLLNSGLTTLAQVQAAMTDTGNGYSILVLDADTQVWIIGVTPGQLTAGDVVFS